jgi:hypothetical protein
MASAYTLDSLIKDLQKSTYTPRSEEQRKQAATNRYASVYDQQRLGAQQAVQTSDLAMQQQAAALDRAYGKQLEQSAANYRLAGSQADRSMLKRGMQRSSYGASTLGNIAIAGNKAQDEIMGAKTEHLGNIEQQRALLARQLADQMRQYSASEQSDILAYMDQLESQDYERGTQAQQYNNSLAAQIYGFQQQETAFNENIRQFNEQLGFQKQQLQQSQENWLKEFEQSVRQYDQSFAEQVRQYNAGLSMEEKKMAMSASQFEQSLAANKEQFAQSLALDQQKLGMSQAQWEAEFAENQKRYADAQAAAAPAATSTASGTSSGTLSHWAKLGYPSQAAYNEAKAKGWNYTQWKANQNAAPGPVGAGAIPLGGSTIKSPLQQEIDKRIK